MKEPNRPSSYDENTRSFYDLHAKDRAALYASVPSPYVQMVSPFLGKKARILDVGCGSGRDLKAFLDAGFDAYGIEPSEGMRQSAAQRYAFDELRLRPGALPLRLEASEGTWLNPKDFDLILCSAVLQHVEERDLFETLFSLDRVLKDDGLLLIAVPSAYPGIDSETERDTEGRRFILRPPEQYNFFLSRLGFTLLLRKDAVDSLGREGIVWARLLFRKRKEPALRPIKQIESIIREDTKTTTYKFALLRSLAELAVMKTEPCEMARIGKSLYPSRADRTKMAGILLAPASGKEHPART